MLNTIILRNTVLDAYRTTLDKMLKADIQFQVPIYQRTYDWTKENIRQLFDDIVKAGRDRKQSYHFIGAITCVPMRAQIGEVDRYQLIDGQQRITSLMLLLRALRDTLKGSKVTDVMINQRLFNTNERNDGPNYYKTVLLDDDDRAFREIMKGGTANKSSNIAANFRSFAAWLRDQDADSVWYGIQSLNAVMIPIGEKDDVQAIFESMNSTGLNLSPTDMIQNYMLMAKDPEWQERIYKEYWLPMERRFLGNGREFDEFFRCYLMKEGGEFISKGNVYREFKKHMVDRERDGEIREMERHSKYYLVMRAPPDSGHVLGREIANIRRQDTNVADSLLLRVIADHDAGRISKDNAQKVLQLVDSYLVRSYVCGTLKGGNRFFPELIKRIDEKRYAESIEEALTPRAVTRRFPSDETFRDQLEHSQLYMSRAICKYVLFRLEHGRGKEQVDWDDIEIEHVMPQTLSDVWRADLGAEWREIHERYVHTIGNLTLTAYNPELGNKRFMEKREIYEKSRFLMNRSIAGKKKWAGDEIQERAKSLADKAVELWKRPSGSDDTVEDDTAKESDREEEVLEWMNVPGLWRALKRGILTSCPGTTFHMTREYGAFRIPADGKMRGLLVCNLYPRKSRIELWYNFKKAGRIIRPREFRKYASTESNAYGYPFTVASEDDIPEAVMLAKAVWESKREKQD